MAEVRYELLMPDLGLPATPAVASSWLVEAGRQVRAGDRLLEVLAGSVTVDLPAPAAGVVSQLFVEEDDPLSPGQVLALILADE